MNLEVKETKEIEPEEDVLSKTPQEIISVNASENEKTEVSISSQQTDTQIEKVDEILSNNKISKARLDQTMNDCKRINNNLKLYLMINTDKSDLTSDDEDQAPICNFKIRHLFYCSKSLNESKLECLENSLCVLMNSSIIIFKILDLELFNENAEFDKCLKKEFSVKLEQIEEIEIGLANNYIYIGSNEAQVQSLKLFTQDIYQTYVLRNILLSIELLLFLICGFDFESTIKFYTNTYHVARIYFFYKNDFNFDIIKNCIYQCFIAALD